MKNDKNYNLCDNLTEFVVRTSIAYKNKTGEKITPGELFNISEYEMENLHNSVTRSIKEMEKEMERKRKFKQFMKRAFFGDNFKGMDSLYFVFRLLFVGAVTTFLASLLSNYIVSNMIGIKIQCISISTYVSAFLSIVFLLCIDERVFEHELRNSFKKDSIKYKDFNNDI